MVMYEVIVGLLSTSQLTQIEVPLLHVNLLLDQDFQFDRWVYCGSFCCPIGLGHIGLRPTKVHVHIEGQRSMSCKQRLLGMV